MGPFRRLAIRPPATSGAAACRTDTAVRCPHQQDVTGRTGGPDPRRIP